MLLASKMSSSSRFVKSLRIELDLSPFNNDVNNSLVIVGNFIIFLLESSNCLSLGDRALYKSFPALILPFLQAYSNVSSAFKNVYVLLARALYVTNIS